MTFHSSTFCGFGLIFMVIGALLFLFNVHNPQDAMPAGAVLLILGFVSCLISCARHYHETSAEAHNTNQVAPKEEQKVKQEPTGPSPVGRERTDSEEFGRKAYYV